MVSWEVRSISGLSCSSRTTGLSRGLVWFGLVRGFGFGSSPRSNESTKGGEGEDVYDVCAVAAQPLVVVVLEKKPGGLSIPWRPLSICVRRVRLSVCV